MFVYTVQALYVAKPWSKGGYSQHWLCIPIYVGVGGPWSNQTKETEYLFTLSKTNQYMYTSSFYLKENILNYCNIKNFDIKYCNRESRIFSVRIPRGHWFWKVAWLPKRYSSYNIRNPPLDGFAAMRFSMAHFRELYYFVRVAFSAELI